MTGSNQNQGGQQGDQSKSPGQQTQNPGQGGQQGDRKPAEKPAQQAQK
jgi:hypothetical protein